MKLPQTIKESKILIKDLTSKEKQEFNNLYKQYLDSNMTFHYLEKYLIIANPKIISIFLTKEYSYIISNIIITNSIERNFPKKISKFFKKIFTHPQISKYTKFKLIQKVKSFKNTEIEYQLKKSIPQVWVGQLENEELFYLFELFPEVAFSQISIRLLESPQFYIKIKKSGLSEWNRRNFIHEFLRRAILTRLIKLNKEQSFLLTRNKYLVTEWWYEKKTQEKLDFISNIFEPFLNVLGSDIKFLPPGGSIKLNSAKIYFKYYASSKLKRRLVKYHPYWGRFISKEELTEIDALLLVSRNAKELKNLPTRLRTRKVCERAIKKSRQAIQWIPPEIYTDSMVMERALKDKNALKYIKKIKNKTIRKDFT